MVELGNWIILKPGIPVKLHFKAHKIAKREIIDRIFKVPRNITSLMFLVDEEGGSPVDKAFSVISTKLMGDFSGYLEGDRYKNYMFTIIKDAEGTVPPRIVEVVPR